MVLRRDRSRRGSLGSSGAHQNMILSASDSAMDPYLRAPAPASPTGVNGWQGLKLDTLVTHGRYQDPVGSTGDTL